MHECSSRAGFSLVIPFYNEAESLGHLLAEINELTNYEKPFEVVAVNDGSTDETATLLKTASRQYRWLQVITHRQNRGQSAALLTGVRAAQYESIVTADGDGQNNPDDIPRLLECLANGPAFQLIAGWRRNRNDSWIKRASSRIANRVRARVLNDQCPDTGCGLKAFYRADFLALPSFDHMHRFLPALFQAAGGRVSIVEVEHRPRRGGYSKYGVNNRLWVGLIDLLAVRWLLTRQRPLAPRSDLT